MTEARSHAGTALGVLASIALVALPTQVLGEPKVVTRALDRRLATYEKTDRPFVKTTLGSVSTYFHQRKIGVATVEKDYVRYRIDESSGALIEKGEHWRTDLPDRLPTVIGKAAAEAKARGVVQRSRLVYISPRSVVYRLRATPANPCWVVRSVEGKRIIVTIVDAVTGEALGTGIPPPASGLAIDGPDWGDCPQDSYWDDWANNAKDWFQQLAYSPASSVGNASPAAIRARLQSDDTAVFYELDHGGSTSFHVTCNEDLNASDVGSWLAGYANVPFAFIGSCEGMCDTQAGTFAYEFRKNLPDAAVVGYCGMSSAACDDCWGDSIDWQDDLFDRLTKGDTVKAAFDHANSQLPSCGNASCMRFAGDETLKLSPVAGRSLCGRMPIVPQTNLSVFGRGNRDDYVRCDITGTIAVASQGATLAFVNAATVKAQQITIDGRQGAVSLVSERDRRKGLKVYGVLVLGASGGIRIQP